MKLEEALEKLYSMHQFGIKLGLDNIRNLLAYLGNPEKKINAIHMVKEVRLLLLQAYYKKRVIKSDYLLRRI